MDSLVDPRPAQGLANMTASWAMADAQARQHGNAQYVAGWNDAMAENRKLKENFMKLKKMYADVVDERDEAQAGLESNLYRGRLFGKKLAEVHGQEKFDTWYNETVKPQMDKIYQDNLKAKGYTIKG
jgi:hypothetical protein